MGFMEQHEYREIIKENQIVSKSIIFDALGNQIEIGNIIAIATANRFRYGVVTSIGKRALVFSTISGNVFSDFIFIVENFQQKVIKVYSPVYSIHNPQIAKLMEVANSCVDDGYFPKDYKFGESISLNSQPLLEDLEEDSLEL